MASEENFLSGRTIALTLTIGAGGTLVVGIQPLLLETLLSQGRVNANVPHHIGPMGELHELQAREFDF